MPGRGGSLNAGGEGDVVGWHWRLASVQRKHWQDASASRCRFAAETRARRQRHPAAAAPLCGRFGGVLFLAPGKRRSQAVDSSRGSCPNVLCRHWLRRTVRSANIRSLRQRPQSAEYLPPWSRFRSAVSQVGLSGRASQGRAAAVKDDRLQQQGVLNVRKSYLMAVFAACAAAALAWMSLVGGPALAQRPGVPQVSSTTVLIDILYILKHHDGFKAEDGATENGCATSARQFKREGEEITEVPGDIGLLPSRHPRLQGRARRVHPRSSRTSKPASKRRSRISASARLKSTTGCTRKFFRRSNTTARTTTSPW